MNNIGKLPKWAQDMIRRLNGEIQALTDSRAPHDGSLIEWGWKHDGTSPHGNIPTSSVVHFIIDPARYVQITCRMDEDNMLHVNSSSTLLVYPRSCNVIHCKVQP